MHQEELDLWPGTTDGPVDLAQLELGQKVKFSKHLVLGTRNDRRPDGGLTMSMVEVATRPHKLNKSLTGVFIGWRTTPPAGTVGRCRSGAEAVWEGPQRRVALVVLRANDKPFQVGAEHLQACKTQSQEIEEAYKAGILKAIATVAEYADLGWEGREGMDRVLQDLQKELVIETTAPRSRSTQ